MSKLKLLYVSPFPPLKSGIADYSERLVRVLSEKFDVSLYTGNYNVCKSLERDFTIYKHGVNVVNFNDFDKIIYNIGNNGLYHDYIYEVCLKHPGFVILHDMVIIDLLRYMYFAKNLFLRKLFKYSSMKNFYIVKTMIKKGKWDQSALSRIPFNEELLSSKNKIIVHSMYSYNKILDTGLISKDNLFKVNLMSLKESDVPVNKKDELFEKYDIPQDAFIISSFGNIISNKLNDYTCRVLKNIESKIDKKICFVLVGETIGDGKKIDKYLEKNFILKTGYTNIDEFKDFMKYSDVIVNLRYPPLGETSAALIQILKNGKPCIINPDGSFAEIPQTCVYRVSRDSLENDLEKALLELINNKELREKIGKNAKAYIEKEYNDSKILKDFERILSLG